MELSPKTGKALDISGAFVFAGFAVISANYGLALLAISAILAVAAFCYSFAAWMTFRDLSAFGRRRLASLGFAIASAAVFCIAVPFEVFA